MRTRILIVCAALAVLTLSFSSCKKDKKVDNVKLAVTQEKDGVKIMVGMTATLEIKTQPAKAEYTCVSKDPSIATVDNKGVITGVKVGETTVTVTAGSATKSVKVTVIPKIEIDKSLYLGKLGEKDIPAIYMPLKDADLTKDKQTEIFYAMEEIGWVASPFDDDKNSEMSFRFTAPKNTRWLMWDFVYIFKPSQGDKFTVGTQSAWTEDPFAKGVTGDVKKRQDAIKLLSEFYGFTESFQWTVVNDKWNGFVSYNLSRSGNPLKLLAYALPRDIKGEDGSTKKYYFINFQINWEAPQKKQMGEEIILMPALENNVDLSMLLQRMK